MTPHNNTERLICTKCKLKDTCQQNFDYQCIKADIHLSFTQKQIKGWFNKF